MYRCKLFLIMVLVLVPGQVPADIYMFVDSSGVVHFTNVPTSPEYKLYIRETGEGAMSTAGAGRFDRHILRAAGKFDVEASLIKAVIEAESGFDPKAKSKKGAKGLMQIMPDNYKALGITDPFDPLQNIMGGTRYLKRLVERYNGRLTLALAAYNAGPDAVDRYRAVPPFKETKQFVSKVMHRYTVYKAKF
ncbi:MAG TPA: transglycosylase SLT domain-containing protein [Desulfobacteraceae bacterium]|nr:transglycosylase SLT domain-containing protein [Desulfobacteraceae bacterium]